MGIAVSATTSSTSTPTGHTGCGPGHGPTTTAATSAAASAPTTTSAPTTAASVPIAAATTTTGAERRGAPAAGIRTLMALGREQIADDDAQAEYQQT